MTLPKMVTKMVTKTMATPAAEPTQISAPRRLPRLLVVGLTLALTALNVSASAGIASTGAPAPSWQQVASPSAGPFRGIAAVSRNEVWIGGDDGELWRTTDGGSSWRDVAPPNSSGLGLRRIVPLGHGHVVLFSRGGVDDPDAEEPSLAARIYVSTDNGRTWHLSFRNEDAGTFYDCLDMFADGRHGLALGEPVTGSRFRILATADGGRSWQLRPRAGMPTAVDGEFAFATGRCMRTSGDRQAWFGTASAAARIFHSTDAGLSWTATDSTLAADIDSGGVFGLDVVGSSHVIAVGGTFSDIDRGVDASAFTSDGRNWRAGGRTGGLRATVAWLPGRPGMAIAGGYNGTDITRDGGRTWATFSQRPYGQVDCASDGACWGTGEDGTISRLSLH